MRSVREIRCKVHGKLLFKIIDNEWIEVYCDKCKKPQRYKIPERLLTDYINAGRIVLK